MANFIWKNPTESITKQRKKDINTKISSFRLFRTSFLYQTKEFFKNSTLHGVRYIAETNRPVVERLMWFCFTVIGLICALVIIVSLWEKFQTNPTITGVLALFKLNWNEKTYIVANGFECTISPSFKWIESMAVNHK